MYVLVALWLVLMPTAKAQVFVNNTLKFTAVFLCAVSMLEAM